MTYLGECWFKDVRVLLKVVAAVAFARSHGHQTVKNAIEKMQSDRRIGLNTSLLPRCAS